MLIKVDNFVCCYTWKVNARQFLSSNKTSHKSWILKWTIEMGLGLFSPQQITRYTYLQKFWEQSHIHLSSVVETFDTDVRTKILQNAAFETLRSFDSCSVFAYRDSCFNRIVRFSSHVEMAFQDHVKIIPK